MSLHPLGFNVHEQYPGQHPAEAVLDYIMAKLRDHTTDDTTKVSEIERITEHYFDHKATLPPTPDYDKAFAGPMLVIRETAHRLVCGLLPSKDRKGWTISLEEARLLASNIHVYAQYLCPDTEAPTSDRRFQCTACLGEFNELEVTTAAGPYHCGPCVEIK